MLKKLLSTPTAQLGKASRFLVFQIKLWSHCVRLLKENRAGQQAAALSYHTVFGIVPLAIVVLLIFQSMSAYESTGVKFKAIIYEQLHLSRIEYTLPATGEKVMLPEYLDQMIGTFFTGLSKGTVTIFSGILVILAALALLSTIERAFNNIWHVVKGRNIVQRIINYWAILTLVPLLLGAGIFVSTKYAIVGQLQRTVISHIAAPVLSYIIAAVAFFLLYFILPNTKVKPASAVWGAMVGAMVWTVAKLCFKIYVTKFIPYNQVYGVLGLIPLSVLWIFITWLTVLFGLQLTFTTQHLKSLDAAQIESDRKRDEYFIANDTTIINIVLEIAAAFEQNNAPLESQVISSKLNIPPEFIEKILNHLAGCGIIAKTSEPKVGFIPARDPANIKLSEISEAAARAGFAQSLIDRPKGLEQITRSQQNMLSQYNLKQILDMPNETAA
jgi:membrane protein